MLEGDFVEKWIMMHFLREEKAGKSSQRRVRRDAEKRFEEDQRGKNPSENKNAQP
jgi:hypothetical protein